MCHDLGDVMWFGFLVPLCTALSRVIAISDISLDEQYTTVD